MKTQASTPMELGTKSIGRSAHTPKEERSRINPRPTDLILIGDATQCLRANRTPPQAKASDDMENSDSEPKNALLQN
ncbi:hypothetical protein Zmor_021364 [Zophobas morio]|uniref:Uncharacterized protein n=1 Tax=Zophobas morio TaxID=2755281 RepID=A0AA38I9C3_9CUCU|nr:hypothetical protein Zmor_021364 [Zophobas morio]